MFAVRPLFLIVLLLSIAVPSIAQHQIVANPHAVKLRKIWQVRGNVIGGDQVGSGAGGLGDIFGTGYGAWAIAFAKAGQVLIYAGSPGTLSTVPVRTFDSAGMWGGHPVVGDFWGTGHKAIGIVNYPRLRIYRTENNQISDTAAVIWNSFMKDVQLSVNEVQAVDLDGDGADEMIIIAGGGRRNGVGSSRGEIWIYRGGANFQVDSPSVVMRDDRGNYSGFFAAVADFDGDHYVDLELGISYLDGVQRKFFWGSPTSPWSWSIPDRTILLTDAQYNVDARIAILDADGDGIADELRTHLFSPDSGVYLFRSGSGKSMRTRALLTDSADYIWRGFTFSDIGRSGGYISDHSGRFASTALFVQSPFNSSSVAMLLVNGGVSGPDSTYEAFYDGTLDGLIEGSVFRSGGPIPDVNGDGWDDYLAAYPLWYTESASSAPGIAMILAGGPYIPRDSVSLGVRSIAVEGHAAGLSLWPNPVRDELNIAWRGDLKQMPERFTITDIQGRQIASGSVQPYIGAALWHCAGIVPCTYLLNVFDRTGTLVTTAKFIKQ